MTDISTALATVDKAIKVLKGLGTEREDLIILTAHMAGDCFFSAQDIADAVEKPWKFADVLAVAKAELAKVDAMTEWEVTETSMHPLRVNGKPTTQEEIRVNADATLDAWPKASSVECGMAETVLALLDLLEASQDLIDYWLTPKALS